MSEEPEITNDTEESTLPEKPAEIKASLTKLTIPAITRACLKLRVRGIGNRTLLMNNPSPEAMSKSGGIPLKWLQKFLHIRATPEQMDLADETPKGKDKKGRAKKAPRNPEKEYQATRYLNSKGKDCIPANAFLCSMADATRYLAGGELSPYWIHGVINIESPEDLIVIEKAKPEMMLHACRLQHRTLYPVVRAGYKDWEATVPLEFVPELISASQVTNLLNLAGSTVGIGAYRKECVGKFGCFEVIPGDTE